MGLFNRTMVAIPLLVILTIMTFASVMVIDPYMAAILSVSDHSFMSAPILAVRVGLLFAFPGMALAVLVWWVFGDILVDEQQEAVIRP